MDFIKNIELIYNKLKNNIAIILYFIAILTLLVVVLFSDFVKEENIKTILTTEEKNMEATTIKEVSVLDLPLEYFDKELIAETTYWPGESVIIYTPVSLDEGYRSFPTTTITLMTENDLQYSQEIKSLPKPIKNVQEIFDNEPGVYSQDVYSESFTENIEKYGDIAGRFLNEGYFTTKLQEFDVDGDGLKEKIINTCGIGALHCPYNVIIIKNDKIIFSIHIGLVGLGLEKSNTGNGFYVHWTNDELTSRGLCCPIGYMRTRFVYENGEFKPIYEQEVLYVDVEDSSQ